MVAATSPLDRRRRSAAGRRPWRRRLGPRGSRTWTSVARRGRGGADRCLSALSSVRRRRAPGEGAGRRRGEQGGGGEHAPSVGERAQPFHPGPRPASVQPAVLLDPEVVGEVDRGAAWLGTTTRLAAEPAAAARRRGRPPRGAPRAATIRARGGRAAGRSRWRTPPGRRPAPCCRHRQGPAAGVADHGGPAGEGQGLGRHGAASHCWASPKT